MFLHFTSQEERRAYGGSAFLEFQYCRLGPGAPEKKIIAVSSIAHWQNDSIYVYLDDIDDFYQSYADIFTDGLYNSMERGGIDLYGINYYSATQVSAIIQTLEVRKPRGHAPLLEWLRGALPYNGVYILGI